MKLFLDLLQQFIDLPSADPQETRRLLDDLGLEVKGVEETAQGTLFTLETLASRGDHLSIVGIARELSGRLLSAPKNPLISNEFPTKRPSIPVRRLTDRCLRYALLELALPENPLRVRPEVTKYLVDGGGLHPIVDTLNYVLTEVGQPMHAFDRDKVEGEIVVELSTAEESVEALDGKTYRVPPNSILIRDSKKVIAVAGVIGCSNSMVTDQTKRVLLESALFEPVTVRKTARAMGISTDASYAFERGCDAETVVSGLKRAVQLLSSPASSGADAGVHVLGYECLDGKLPEQRKLTLSISAIRAHMNLPKLNEVEVVSRLKYLGFGVVSQDKDLYQVTVPSWRVWDIDGDADLIEEVVRSVGLSKVKGEPPPLAYDIPELSPAEQLVERIEPVLVGNGFLEVITKVFYPAKDAALVEECDPALAGKHLTMKNSLESSYSHLKSTNLIHLAQLAEQNHRRGVLGLKVYEMGRVFTAEKLSDAPYEHEREVLTLAVSGRWGMHEWKQAEPRDRQLAAFTGILESLIRTIGRKCVVGQSENKLLHPGVQGSISVGRKKVGFFGLIHPKLAAALDLKHDLFFAELDVTLLSELREAPRFKPSIDLPVIRRDITVRIDHRAFAQDVCGAISKSGIDNLKDVIVVDDFKRESEDFRRTTFRITFQCAERTLEHAEVDAGMTTLLDYLKSKHRIELAA